MSGSRLGWTTLVWLAAGGLLWAAPQDFAGLEEARRAAQRSARSVEGRVSSDLGRQALGELEVCRIDLVVPYARIAQAGGEGSAAAKALLGRALGTRGDQENCLRALLELPSQDSQGALKDRSRQLGELLLRDPEPSALLLEAFGRVATQRQARDAFEALGREGQETLQDVLIARLGEHGAPGEVFADLAGWEIAAPFQETLARALGRLVERSPQAKAAAQKLLGQKSAALASHTDRVALALVLGRASDAKVNARLADALAGAGSRPTFGIWALLAARRCTPAELERALDLAGSGKAPVQEVALRALPTLLSYSGNDVAAARKVDETITRALTSSDAGAVAGALDAGRQRGLEAASRRIPTLLNSGDQGLRLAAIRATPKLLRLSEENAELLLGLFNDSDASVAVLAWRTLEEWAKVRIPRNRADRWRQWRERTFPAGN